MKKRLLAVISAFAGSVAGAVVMHQVKKPELAAQLKIIEKLNGYHDIFNQWLFLKQEGKSLEQYFVNNGYESIAIYGAGEMGEHLYDELRNSDKVKIKYVIDKYAGSIDPDLKVLKPEDDLPKVDVIVVTATFAFDEIEEMLRKKVDYSIVSLEIVVDEA